MADDSVGERLQAGLVAAFTRVFAALDDARIESRSGYTLLMCPDLPLPQFNGVWAQRDGGAAVAELGAALSEVEGLGLPFWLQTRVGRHPLVEQEAARLGLGLAEQVSGMVAASADLMPSPPGGVGIEIECVADGERLGQALAVAEAGFETPAGTLAPLYTERLAATPGMVFYLGSVDGEPVSTALGCRCNDTVGIFNVATLPDHRGRGCGTALSARATGDGFAGGARLALLQSSAEGASVYRRVGFDSIETYNLFTRG
jgi:GNAT superfamily N-acetyltransferase